MGYISDSHYWLVIYHRGAFGVARFDQSGNFQSLYIVERAQTAPRFFFVSGLYIYLTS